MGQVSSCYDLHRNSFKQSFTSPAAFFFQKWKRKKKSHPWLQIDKEIIFFIILC